MATTSERNIQAAAWESAAAARKPDVPYTPSYLSAASSWKPTTFEIQDIISRTPSLAQISIPTPSIPESAVPVTNKTVKVGDEWLQSVGEGFDITKASNMRLLTSDKLRVLADGEYIPVTDTEQLSSAANVYKVIGGTSNSTANEINRLQLEQSRLGIEVTRKQLEQLTDPKEKTARDYLEVAALVSTIVMPLATLYMNYKQQQAAMAYNEKMFEKQTQADKDLLFFKEYGYWPGEGSTATSSGGSSAAAAGPTWATLKY